MDFADRVRVHAALGEEHRLRMVDALAHTDLTFSQLGAIVELPGNALAHHLAILVEAGLVTRHTSEGDRRRRYLRLDSSMLGALSTTSQTAAGSVVFVCTHNSARSQFAAAQWEAATGAPAQSVGSDPAEAVNPMAVRVAASFGLDLSGAEPRGYESLVGSPDLVISVCDRAREGGLPTAPASLHWSTPDPVDQGTPDAFEGAFSDLAGRISHLAEVSA